MDSRRQHRVGHRQVFWLPVPGPDEQFGPQPPATPSHPCNTHRTVASCGSRHRLQRRVRGRVSRPSLLSPSRTTCNADDCKGIFVFVNAEIHNAPTGRFLAKKSRFSVDRPKGCDRIPDLAFYAGVLFARTGQLPAYPEEWAGEVTASCSGLRVKPLPLCILRKQAEISRRPVGLFTNGQSHMCVPLALMVSVGPA